MTGDIVEFIITPESGKKLAKIEVENGGAVQDLTASVQNGKLSVVCKGDISVNAMFADEN